MGYQILPLYTEGGWYYPNGLLILPPGAFLVLGLLLGAVEWFGYWRAARAKQNT